MVIQSGALTTASLFPTETAEARIGEINETPVKNHIALMAVMAAGLSVTARGDQAADEFVRGIRIFANTIATVQCEDCACWAKVAKASSLIARCAKRYLMQREAGHRTVNPLVARFARAWIDQATLETAYYTQWPCKPDSFFTKEELALKIAMLKKIVAGDDRLKDALDKVYKAKVKESEL